MVLYFSATGNSRYAARRIAALLHDDIEDLFPRIREHDYTQLHSNRPWVIVTPTYAWRIPRIVQDWLTKTRLAGNREIYFIMTCGDGIGNGSGWVKKLCKTIGMDCRGCFPLLMPENYTAMFPIPSEEKIDSLITDTEMCLVSMAYAILRRETAFPARIHLPQLICSGPVNPLFYRFFVRADKFYPTDACISCGKCVQLCPLQNIRLENGRPVWDDNCTHCMACINRCPAGAIEYGTKSLGKPRYTCPADGNSAPVIQETAAYRSMKVKLQRYYEELWEGKC